MANSSIETPVSTFSLLDEAWIPVRGAEGERLLSLNGVFSEAEKIHQITGELPTQTFAMMRLLLAIVRRALSTDLVSIETWADIWDAGLPTAQITEYLEKHRDRFDLLDAVAPFYQAPGIHTEKHEVKDITPLLFDVPANNRLFTTRSGSSLKRISYAEAARWVVHAQAFDVSGIKSGLVGDDRVRGGKGYPIGTGWAGAIGGVLLEGNSLAETLLLNLRAVPEEVIENDIAPWERGPDSAAVRHEAQPRGPVDLLTWQSRRIRLVHDGIGITGCVLGNGDSIAPQNLYEYEHMTAWRYSEPQSKKIGRVTYMPRTHTEGRSLWRGVNSLMAKRENPIAGKNGPSGFAPGTITWILLAQEMNFLPSDQRITVRAIGVLYGSQSSVVSEIFDDTVFLSLVVLDEIGAAHLSALVQSAVGATDAAVRSYGYLARNLALAAGSSPDEANGPREAAQAEAYAAVDRPFREWLSGIDPQQDSIKQSDEWKSTAKNLLRVMGNRRIEAASPRAWSGRTVDLGMAGGSTLLCASTEDSKFRRAIDRELVLVGQLKTSTKSNKGVSD